MAGAFPTSLAQVADWCEERGFPRQEGRVRFVGYVILECIGSDPLLSGGLAFKGGNALRFVHGSPRSTIDLDFTAMRPEIKDSADWLRDRMDGALRYAFRRQGIKVRCQSVKRNPKRSDATRPTYTLKAGYQFPGDRHFGDFERNLVASVLPIEISLNDRVCETVKLELSRGKRIVVEVCTLEDIIAEKLRSILQQRIRNRIRSQDVYDVARCVSTAGRRLDMKKVATYFIEKCEARDVTGTKSGFDEVIRMISATGYAEQIARQTRDSFIPFDAAWNAVIAFIRQLEIPD